MGVTYSFPGPPFFVKQPDPLPLSFPDYQAEWRKQVVCDEREACARLAESQGQGVLASAIRARGGVPLAPGSNEVRATVKPAPPSEPSPFGRAVAEAAERLARENPPPPDALLPDGYSRWWPRVDIVDREEGLCARLTWEAKP